jgi:hypothetical protein
MNCTNMITTGIAAFLGATLLIATPTTSSASSPTRRDVCPAIDTEPLCDLLRDVANANGAGLEPAIVGHPTPRDHAVIDCTGRPIIRVYACAE